MNLQLPEGRCSPALFAWLALALLAGLIAARPAAAQETWTLTDAGLRDRVVMIDSLDADGVSVRSSTAGQGQLAWDQVVQLHRNAPARPGHAADMVYLWSGDRYTGKPGDFAADTLTWNSPLLGAVKIPLGQLKAIVQVAAVPADLDDARTDDTVHLTNGDTAHGVITAVGNGTVSLQTTGDPVPIPIDSVQAVLFATPLRKPAPQPRAWRIQFGDGTLLTAGSVKLANVHLTAGFSDRTVDLDLGSVVSIEQINGPISWLAGRAPSLSVQTPFWGDDRPWPAQFGMTVDGRPIRFGSRVYSHGIGVHAFSRLSYPLDGAYAALLTGYAVTGDGSMADMTVRILLDSKVVRQQEHVRAGQVMNGVLIDLRGAKELTLEVDYGPSGDFEDRLAWLDPALLRVMPPVSPTPAAVPAPPATAPTDAAPGAPPAPAAPAAPANF